MLELRDLSFAYPAGRPLIAGLSFTFRSGGICAVLGPNGTGKTTLLKLLLGILKPSSGEMLLSVFRSVYLSSYCLDANRGLCGSLPLPMWR